MARSPMFYVGLLAVVIVPLAYLNDINRFVQLPQALTLHIVALAGFLIWFCHGRWRSSILVLPALVFFFAETVSILQAQTRIFALLPISMHLAGLGFFLALLNGLKRDDYALMMQVACCIAGGISVFGLMQFFGFASNWVPTAGLPSATFGHRNLAAAYLVGLIPVTLYFLLSAKNQWSIWGWGFVVGMEGAFLLATRSRAAWVGLFVAFLVVGSAGFLKRKQVRWPFFLTHTRCLGLGLALLIMIGSATIPAQISKEKGAAMWQDKVTVSDAVTSVVSTHGDKSRLTLWKHTFSMIGEHPILGVGAGNWRVHYPLFAQGDLMHPRTITYRPHNDFLWVWSETGILGVLGFGGIILVGMLLGWESLKMPANGIAWGLLVGLVAVLVAGSFGFTRAFSGAWLPFWLIILGLGILQAGETRIYPMVRWPIGIGILAIMLSAWGVTKQIDFDRAFLQVRAAFAQEDWSAVIDAADQAEEMGVFHEEMLMMRGRAFEALGDFSRAQKDYLAGIRFQPISVGLWNGLGTVQRGQGDMQGARASFLKALQYDPESGEVLNNLATLYAISGNIDSAFVVYQKALDFMHEADMGPVYANMSVICQKKGQTDDAILYAQKALALKPDHLEALAAAGQAFLAGHRFADAAQAFSKAITLNSKLAQMHFGLAQAYEGLGDARGAGVAYQDFLKLWTGPEVPQVKFAKKRLEFLTSP